MNVTLQPYVQPYVPARLIDFFQPNGSIQSGNHSDHYANQITKLSNSLLPMLNEAEKKFGPSSTEKRTKRHIEYHREKDIKANSNHVRLGCLDPEIKRASLPESTVDVDIEPLDLSMVSRRNVNDKNQDGLTPLMRVALTGNSNEVEHLVRLGAKVDLQDNAGNTALMWVVKSLFRLANETRIQVKLAILDVLITNKADLNLADREGFTPLMIAAMGDDKKGFKKIFINNVMVEQENNDGQTALHLAVKYNVSKNIIDQLSMFYPKMNVSDKDGHTPFMIAFFNGKLDLMDSFFSKGSDVDHMDAKDWTALMYAVDCNNEELVNKLCSYGANVNFTTPHQKSALVIAFENKNKIMALALVKAGAVTANEEIKRWLKEDVITHDSTGGVIANDNIAGIESNVIHVSDAKDETVVVKHLSECGLDGDTAVGSNSSKSGESLYSIPQWILNKLGNLYEAFRRYASPIPPL